MVTTEQYGALMLTVSFFELDAYMIKYHWFVCNHQDSMWLVLRYQGKVVKSHMLCTCTFNHYQEQVKGKIGKTGVRQRTRKIFCGNEFWLLLRDQVYCIWVLHSLARLLIVLPSHPLIRIRWYTRDSYSIAPGTEKELDITKANITVFWNIMEAFHFRCLNSCKP